jgi:hypothetical protein
MTATNALLFNQDGMLSLTALSLDADGFLDLDSVRSALGCRAVETVAAAALVAFVSADPESERAPFSPPTTNAIREMLRAAGSPRAPAVYGSAIIVGPHVPLRPEMAVA